MGRRYRRQSKAGSIARDVSFIANRLPWQGALALGAALFAIFYWLIPAWFRSRLDSMDGSSIRPVVEIMLARRLHWFEWVGIALALICGFFAMRNYLRMKRLGKDGERNVGFWGRLLARIID